jgi:hypothetical protein
MHAIGVMLCVVGIDTSNIPPPTSLRADVHQWQADVSFRCTFTLRSGVAESIERALQGATNPRLGSDYSRWEARGQLMKLGSKARCLIDYGTSGFQYGPDNHDITLEPVEETTDGSIVIRRFLKRHEIFGQYAKVASVALVDKDRGEVWGLSMTSSAILPLSPMHSDQEQPFESLGRNSARATLRLTVCTHKVRPAPSECDGTQSRASRH